MILKSNSKYETHNFGREFLLEKPDSRLILLKGELGMGKTVFAQGLASCLGIDPAIVRSPTFTYFNLYSGEKKLFHFDLYRLGEFSLDLESEIGEILEDPESIMLIEWPEKMPAIKFPHYLIVFEPTNSSAENERILTISFHER